jgi:hypothetical protein
MIKFNKVTIEFTDVDNSIAGIKVLLDPPIPDESKMEELEYVEQPCIMLATKVLGFLKYLRQAEQEGAVNLGEMKASTNTVH